MTCLLVGVSPLCVWHLSDLTPPNLALFVWPGAKFVVAMIDCLSFCCFTTIKTILPFYTFGSRDLALKLRRL